MATLPSVNPGAARTRSADATATVAVAAVAVDAAAAVAAAPCRTARCCKSFGRLATSRAHGVAVSSFPVANYARAVSEPFISQKRSPVDLVFIYVSKYIADAPAGAAQRSRFSPLPLFDLGFRFYCFARVFGDEPRTAQVRIPVL